MSSVDGVARWLRFNAVGAIGAGVQLATLATLVGPLGMHYLGATALAVELTVLHNYLWHARWTWRDRPPATRRDAARRLLGFHLANGAVSIGGNLALTAAFVEVAGLGPVRANLITIAACSILNFVLSDRLVFTTRRPAGRGGAVPVMGELDG